MDLIVVLSLSTFALVAIFAWWSRRRTLEELHSDDAESSSLARDTPDENFQPRPNDPELSPQPEQHSLSPRPNDPELTPQPDHPKLNARPNDPKLKPRPNDPKLNPGAQNIDESRISG